MYLKCIHVRHGEYGSSHWQWCFLFTETGFESLRCVLNVSHFVLHVYICQLAISLFICSLIMYTCVGKHRLRWVARFRERTKQPGPQKQGQAKWFIISGHGNTWKQHMANLHTQGSYSAILLMSIF